MKIRFDKYQPASKVAPPHNGAVWHQKAEDGQYYYFNVSGSPIDIETGEVLTLELKKAAPETVQSEIVTMDASGNSTTEIVEVEVKPVLDPKIELVKWLHGDASAETNWMKIRGFGKETLGKVASGKEELAGWAIDAGLITQAELRQL